MDITDEDRKDLAKFRKRLQDYFKPNCHETALTPSLLWVESRQFDLLPLSSRVLVLLYESPMIPSNPIPKSHTVTLWTVHQTLLPKAMEMSVVSN